MFPGLLLPKSSSPPNSDQINIRGGGGGGRVGSCWDIRVNTDNLVNFK